MNILINSIYYLIILITSILYILFTLLAFYYLINLSINISLFGHNLIIEDIANILAQKYIFLDEYSNFYKGMFCSALSSTFMALFVFYSSFKYKKLYSEINKID